MDRMFRKLLPKIDEPVMVRVVSVDPDGRGGTVELLGYRNAPIGRINADDDLVLNRIEPAMLSSRDPLLLTKNVSFQGRVTCEKRFYKKKHVYVIMRSVARKTRYELEDLYKLLNWPSYRSLMDLESTFWDFSSLVPDAVRRALRYAVQHITLHTLRITNPQVLLSSYGLIQDRATCWACAEIRQFECLLKENGRMPLEESLCIDDLVSKTAGLDQADEDDGSIGCLSDSQNVFMFMGIKSSQPEAPLYYLSALSVVSDFQHPRSSWNRLIVNMAENLRGSIAVSVVWFPSFDNNLQGQAIYKPTEDEIAAFRRNPRSKKFEVHTMSLTGAGFHEEDDDTLIPYLELLNSAGDVVGDRGFLRFACVPVCPIIEFVEMTL